MKNPVIRACGGWLLLSFTLLMLSPLHAQLTTPELFKTLKDQKAKGLNAKVMMSAKQIGIALFQFENDYGKLPGEKSIEEVSKNAGDGVKIAAASANDCFFQLIAAGMVDDPALFAPDQRDIEKRDNVGIKKLDHCLFSYMPSDRMDRADRPLVVAPLIKGKKTFDPKLLNGKAVVMLTDLSVRMLEIDAEGRVMLDGKDLFDPKQPYWNGKEPVVKWPE